MATKKINEDGRILVIIRDDARKWFNYAAFWVCDGQEIFIMDGNDLEDVKLHAKVELHQYGGIDDDYWDKVYFQDYSRRTGVEPEMGLFSQITKGEFVKDKAGNYRLLNL